MRERLVVAWIAATLPLAWVADAATAHAFSSPSAFTEAAASGGGGGRWFSGSPADALGCDVCHQATKGLTRFPLYVTGLAEDGFAPGDVREIVMSWPEFAARYTQLRGDPMQPRPPEAPIPALGLVAELVAESGKGSGVVELRAGTAGPDELCEVTRPNLKPRLAAQLYQVRTGVPPIEIEPDANGVMRCESKQLGQRCVIALASCGARQTRFVWTAPPQSEGTIWFSAGFVASEAISGTSEGDSAFEVTYPMQEQGGAASGYEQKLQAVCSVRAPGLGAVGYGGGCYAGSVLAWLWLRRVRMRLRTRRRAAVTVVVALLGCGPGAAESPERANPIAGLYAPGSSLGASDPTDVPRPGMGLGERCMPLDDVFGREGGDGEDGGVATGAGGGELMVEYQTQSLDGLYAPKNCTATWIETREGLFVATLEIAAALRRAGLVYFQDHTCTKEPGPDAVTSATLRDHEKLHSLSWTGVDFQGLPVPDGPYRLFIEVTESDKEPGELITYDFEKGLPLRTEAPIPADGPLVSVTLEWVED